MIDQIGNTDLIRSNRLSDLYQCQIYLKAEFQNPGMSAKDRPALYMIRDAEKKGLLKPGYTVVEASSGNTAIGLASICKDLGYSCHFFLSASSSPEKRTLLKLYGADITICDNSNGLDDAFSTLSKAKAWAEEHPQSYFCNQYYNPANVLSHLETTGPEIWEQTGGGVTHFICGVGTGGTISGVGRYLKSQDPTITIIGVDTYGSILYDYFYTGSVSVPSHPVSEIEGIGRKFIPGNLDVGYIDEFIRVSRDEAIKAVYDFIGTSSILPGFSSAAVLAALQKIGPGLRERDSVVLMFADHGCRYMSKIYNQQWLNEHDFEYEFVNQSLSAS